MIVIKSFNGFSLDNESYKTTASSAKTPPDAKPVFLDQTAADALYAGTFTLDVRSVAFTVRILTIANLDVLESQLKEGLKPGTAGLLVGTFSDENRDYQLYGVIQSVHLNSQFDNLFTVVMQTGESAWHAVTESADTWTVAASGATKAITVGGYSQTRLSMTITPTQLPATGWAYQRLYPLVNAAGYAYGLRPWRITLDTAALVSGGKMQADCDDLKVIVDGVEVNRWIADANTSATKIWVNLNLSAGQSLTLLTAIASSGTISSMKFAETKNNSSALKALPGRGFLLHGTEMFEFTGKDLKTYKLTGITRAALGTSMQAHAAADVFGWVEHNIFLLYGNGTATAPSLTDAAYDDSKPVFDLSASANDSWVYTASTKFYDADKPGRTGGWSPTITRVGDKSVVYNGTGNVEGAAPAMGMQISTYYKSGKVTSEKASIAWTLKNAGGITTISMTGKKYRNSTQWPATKAAILQRSANSSTWVEVWSELTPSAVNSWETVTHSGVAITSNMPIVRFLFEGSLAAAADVNCDFEVLTLTAAFVSANLPAGTVGSEKSNYLLNVNVSNSTTGDSIDLVLPMVLNAVMDLDGETYQVTYNGVNANSALALNDDSREVWIRLNPGVNNLVITGIDVATLTVLLSWLERRM